MGWLMTSKKFGVSQATLRRHALEKNDHPDLGEVEEAPLALENPSISTIQVTEVIMQEANTNSPATSQAEEGLLQEEESLKLPATQVLEEKLPHLPKKSLYQGHQKMIGLLPFESIFYRHCQTNSAVTNFNPKYGRSRRKICSYSRVTEALNFSSSTEEDFISLQTNAANDDDGDCIYCNDLYSRCKPKEVWLKCMSCKRWAHP
ncbi:hypothetical protein JTB14_023542 [Gonioctena quinquepunctata]|nr:hypothetical protein JTB14_023542 [Gonioctena quinquepunctata]